MFSQLDLILTTKVGTACYLQCLRGKVCTMNDFRWLTVNGFRPWASDVMNEVLSDIEDSMINGN